MKKILSICICLLIATLPLQAQRNWFFWRKKKESKSIEFNVKRSVEKQSHQKGSAREISPDKNPSLHTQARPHEGPDTRPLAKESVGTSSTTQSSLKALGKRTSLATGTDLLPRAGAATHSSSAPLEKATFSPQTRSSLEGEKADPTQAFNETYGRSVLIVPDVGLRPHVDVLEPGEPETGFTMTIIKKTYDGQEGIYGIIPTHAIASNPGEAKLKMGIAQRFKAKLVLADGTSKRVNAEIVQISPSSMLDISLVKFDKETEALLEPLEISTIPPQPNAPIYSPGYADGLAVSANRKVLKNAFIYIATDLIDVGGNTRGFCGAPLIHKGKVVGFHTGSSNAHQMSYGTQARFVDNLIEAFHNSGYSFYDLVLDGHVLTSLNIDEYISAFGFADEKLEMLYKEDVVGKYSESSIRAAREAVPQAKYLILHSRTAYWRESKSGDFALIEDRHVKGIKQSQLREHIYDLETHQLVAEPAQATGGLPLSLFMDPTVHKSAHTFEDLIEVLWDEE